MSEKNHATSQNTKVTQPLHTQNHAATQQNLAKIAKRCPENMTSVVKCFKFLFPKVLRKFFLKMGGCLIFLWRGCVNFLTTVTNVTKILAQYFWKEQFDTFDNQYDVHKELFCNSRYVFMKLDRVGPIDNRPSTTEAPPIGKIHTFSKIAIILDTVMRF